MDHWLGIRVRVVVETTAAVSARAGSRGRNSTPIAYAQFATLLRNVPLSSRGRLLFATCRALLVFVATVVAKTSFGGLQVQDQRSANEHTAHRRPRSDHGHVALPQGPDPKVGLVARLGVPQESPNADTDAVGVGAHRWSHGRGDCRVDPPYPVQRQAATRRHNRSVSA
jgi:hypothetical protein